MAGTGEASGTGTGATAQLAAALGATGEAGAAALGADPEGASAAGSRAADVLEAAATAGASAVAAAAAEGAAAHDAVFEASMAAGVCTVGEDAAATGAFKKKEGEPTQVPSGEASPTPNLHCAYSAIRHCR